LGNLPGRYSSNQKKEIDLGLSKLFVGLYDPCSLGTACYLMPESQAN